MTTPTTEPGPGDIGVTQIRGNVGLLIRLGQWLNGDGFANYEHCFVMVDDGQIIEAEPGGARLANLNEYDTRTIAWLRCPDQHRQAVTESAEALEGKPYSFLDYLALAAHRLHLPIPGLRHYIDSTGHLLCSQLADRAAELGGWHLFTDGRWSGYVTPADIAALALAAET